ncbi:MAG: hypothetical protein HRT61_13060 [Ekhidna sp.]|nr:hypothetical protein [Ekhidna sp.]
MLSKNKIYAYLLYAVGEIFLVVVGILIAVSIDDWNSKRKTLDEETVLLSKLLQEQIADKKVLENAIERHEWMNGKLDTLQSIIYHLEQIDLDSIDQQRFEIYLNILYYTPSYKPKQGFLNSAISSGQIALISNDSISSIIAYWGGLYQDYQESVENVNNLVSFQIIPYLTGKHPFSNASKALQIIENSFGSKFKYDRKQVLNDMKVESLTELKRVDAELALEKAKKLPALNDVLIQLLEKEIKSRK